MCSKYDINVCIVTKQYLCQPIRTQGSTLLIDAIKRGDGFAAQFLLEQRCNVNLVDRNSADTALHLASTYADSGADSATYEDMLTVARSLLDEHRADPNLRNQKG